MAREGIESAPWVVAARVGRGDFPFRHAAIREALAFVETRGADQSERRALRQMLRERAIVRERREALRFLRSVNPLVGNQGARPALVVVRVVLDQPHLRRFLDHRAILDQINPAIELRQMCVLMIHRPGRIDGEHVVVRRTRRMRELADGRRMLVAQHGRIGRSFDAMREWRERHRTDGHERQVIPLRLRVVEASVAPGRAAVHVRRVERGRIVRRPQQQLDVGAEAGVVLVVIFFHHERAIRELRLKVKPVRRVHGVERAHERRPPCRPG
jgi:hypothetical protein